MNFVFYVCDTDSDFRKEHMRKMEAGRVVAQHIKKGLNDCTVKKYNEYESEYLDCDSVGLVVPTYRWGLSFAVYSFLQNLRVSDKTYVYIAVVGETISECADVNLSIRLLNLATLRKKFKRNGLGDDKDIYVRNIDLPRSVDYTEMRLNKQDDIGTKIEKIMSGLLMYSIESMSNAKKAEEPVIENLQAAFEENEPEAKDKKRLNNVYLDEEFLAGVRLCRAL